MLPALIALHVSGAPTTSSSIWDLRTEKCKALPVCPFVDQTHSYSQGREDLFIRKNFYCDTCEQRNEVPQSGTEITPGLRTYVEIGALNGRLYSNTLMLQTKLGFGGVLIEGHPENAAKLRHLRGVRGGLQTGKRARNHVFGEAVCDGHRTVTYIGGADGGTAGAAEEMSAEYLKNWRKRFVNQRNYTVPCRPIREMLQAARVSRIDFFSLDVEGAELSVLQTFDWAVPVNVWMIESPPNGGAHVPRHIKLRKLLAANGYADSTLRIGPNEIWVPRASLAFLKSRRKHCVQCIQRGVTAEIARLRQAADLLESRRGDARAAGRLGAGAAGKNASRVRMQGAKAF